MNQPFEPAHSASAGARRAGISVCRTDLAAPQVWLRVPGMWLRLAGGLALSLALTGCRHKTLWVPPASTTAPVDLVDIPTPDDLPNIATVSPPVFVPSPTIPPKKLPRKKAPVVKEPAATPPAQVASAAEPAELAIGSLTTGGESAPQTQQQARDLIGAIQKRITELPRSVASQQKSQLRQVNRFLKDAQQALDSGDADGAVTLATKARLIMDDVEKK